MSKAKIKPEPTGTYTVIDPKMKLLDALRLAADRGMKLEPRWIGGDVRMVAIERVAD